MATAQKYPGMIRDVSLARNPRPWKQGWRVGWSREERKTNKMRNTENKRKETCVFLWSVQCVLGKTTFSRIQDSRGKFV